MFPLRTKIICTIGPASGTFEIIKAFAMAGMRVARLNFSHGTYEDHERLISIIRKVEADTNIPIAVMQDLQGPKIRLGQLPDEGVMVADKTMVVFDTSIKSITDNKIPVDFLDLHRFVAKGNRLFISDGAIETVVESVNGTQISARVVRGGALLSHKGINVPDSELPVSSLTDKDREDVRFGVAHEVDIISLSFVQTPQDILDLKYEIEAAEKEQKIDNNGAPIWCVAKIERGQAVRRFEDIVSVADGIMIARGDLGVETPAVEVPLVQKRLIDLSLLHGVPVIVATQMLDSMQEHSRPTRAEVSDVANAVIDHADAIMLSNETATGKFPVEAVQTMADIARQAENSTYDNLPMNRLSADSKSVEETITRMARIMAEETKATLILTASFSGATARHVARYRPELPIAVATRQARTRRQLSLVWGLIPFLLPACRSIEELVDRSIVSLKELGHLQKGDKIVIVSGEPVGVSGNVNLLEVREIS